MSSSHTSAITRFTPERLKSMFTPKTIALVGASDKSPWSMLVNGMLRLNGYRGHIYYVNPRAETVHGQPAVPNLAAIGAPVDLVYIMVPQPVVLPVLQEMVVADMHNAVILTGGFAEAGTEGIQLQQEITALAHAHDLAIIGPNCLGYINVAQHVGAMPNNMVKPTLAGPVGIVSQSGATGGIMLSYAESQGIGLSAMISTGNEAVLTITEAMDYLIDDDDTRVLAVFMETIRRPDAFIRAARRAHACGKPIVALKAGRSEASIRVAQAHTAALTGDDKVIDALFRQLGIMRVDSIEELVLTADIVAKIGVLAGNRLGVVAMSGGICDMAADQAEQSGLTTPEFAEETRAKLHELLPAIGAAHNPLDTTGAAVTNQALMGQMLAAVGQDPHLDVVICTMGFPQDDSPSQQFIKKILGGIADATRESRAKTFVIDHIAINMPPAGVQFAQEVQLPFASGGLQQVIKAVGKIAWWSRQRALPMDTDEPGAVPQGQLSAPPQGTWSEHQAQQLLNQHGIPVVPSALVADADAAAHAASTLGFPVALKIASPEIVHKSDIGGVKLHLRDEAAVREAFDSVMQAAAQHAPDARIEGALLSPMRCDGVELLVGVVRDASFGHVLAVGIGGVYVEVLKDTSLRVLPVGRAEVRAMLDELQGKALLQGARGAKPANMDALADTIYRIGALAQALGDDLESLEINPLRVDGDQIEALDALVTWRRA